IANFCWATGAHPGEVDSLRRKGFAPNEHSGANPYRQSLQLWRDLLCPHCVMAGAVRPVLNTTVGIPLSHVGKPPLPTDRAQKNSPKSKEPNAPGAVHP